MKSYGPKALLQLPTLETLITRQIRLLRKRFGHANFTVVTGFESEKVKRFLPRSVKTITNHNYANTNVAHSLAIAFDRLPAESSVLVVYGDLVFNSAALRDLDLSRSCVVMDTDANGTRSDEVGVNVADGEVLRFSYAMPDKWAQIFLLKPAERRLFSQAAKEPSRQRYFGYEILNDVIDRGGKLHAIYPDGLQLMEIDNSRDIDRVSVTSIAD